MKTPGSSYFVGGSGGGGLIASFCAARCNCSLNNHLSGVASLPFSTGLHSVLSHSEASPTRTVAFLCLPGQPHQPFHQGWLLETFLFQRYIHLMWSRPMSWTLSDAGKQEESPCCTNWRVQFGETPWWKSLTTTDNYTLEPRIWTLWIYRFTEPWWHTSLVGLSWANSLLCHCEVLQASLPAKLYFKHTQHFFFVTMKMIIFGSYE